VLVSSYDTRIASKAFTYDAHGATKGRPDVVIHALYEVVVGLPRLASISQYLFGKQYRKLLQRTMQIAIRRNTHLRRSQTLCS
jgi:hypothetical protein